MGWRRAGREGGHRSRKISQAFLGTATSDNYYYDDDDMSARSKLVVSLSYCADGAAHMKHYLSAGSHITTCLVHISATLLKMVIEIQPTSGSMRPHCTHASGPTDFRSHNPTGSPSVVLGTVHEGGILVKLCQNHIHLRVRRSH